MNNDKQKLFERIFKEHLKVETYSKSIDSLYSPRLLNKINYKPYYQRNYVWDDSKATYFIESILMGTEIPPLIFFDNNEQIEIIDGRQRFETILRFMQNKFTLKKRGLQALSLLKGENWDSLGKKEKEIIDSFTDAKLRIIEFKLVNEPPLDKSLEDQIKKEIFSRYNSGITPLKKAEIENAIYDDDELTGAFKTYLEENKEFTKKLYSTFFKPISGESENPPHEKLLTFIRKSLVLPQFPINFYTRGTGRTDILARLYEFFADSNVDNHREIIEKFVRSTEFIFNLKQYCETNELNSNRLAFDCFLWGIGVLQLEEVEINFNRDIVASISKHIHENISEYTEQDYGFTAEVMNRYSSTAKFLSQLFKTNFDIYIVADDEGRERMKEARVVQDTTTKLSELESLRLSKPEPSRTSIDDISRMLLKRRFLIRPSYQRKEVINITKASSIIESILLGIALPAIFIYKRKDGIQEVIDGQQRLLTILGFLGAEYINEKGKNSFSKNHKFALRKLRILKELNGSKFDDLDEKQKDKIFDFQLYLVEIDQIQNPYFEPVDLFIRLNDKPYPIRENSFEMWNSWADIEIIEEIKKLKEGLSSWFYQKQLKKSSDRDRMENEELLMSLAYIEYYNKKDKNFKVLDTYQKTDRINSRISTKAKISALMQLILEDESIKKEFLTAIKNVKSFIKKIKYILLDTDKSKEELSPYLSQELDLIFKANKESRYFRRTIQDFYFMWQILGDINFQMVKHHRLEMKAFIKEYFQYLKNIPEEHQENNIGFNNFQNRIEAFSKKYSKDERKLKLTEDQKLDMIKMQGNVSSLSTAPIFLGDDIEVDHIEAIAIGGKDENKNLGIAHDTENREKGAN